MEVAKNLKQVYTAVSVAAALDALTEFPGKRESVCRDQPRAWGESNTRDRGYTDKLVSRSSRAMTALGETRTSCKFTGDGSETRWYGEAV